MTGQQTDTFDWTSLPWFDEPPPNLDRARMVDVIPAEELTAEYFRTRYWARNRPLLIKGALNHMDAIEKWRSVEYLREKTRETNVLALNTPLLEFAKPNEGEHESFAGIILDSPDALEVIPLSQFWDTISGAEPRPMWAYASPLPEKPSDDKLPPEPTDQWNHEVWSQLDTVCPFAGLRGDLSDFPFITGSAANSKGRFYRKWRLFVYHASYTDWHAHPIDAHLMCQFRGGKHVVMLEPNEGFQKIWPMMQRARHGYLASREKDPEYFEIEPYYVHVEEGDAMYIPIYWWHAVAAPPRDFGITGAFTWPSPRFVSGDWHFAFTRLIWDEIPAPTKVLLSGFRAWSRGYRTWCSLTSKDDSWDWRTHGG